jgi:hypothetical protein
MRLPAQPQRTHCAVNTKDERPANSRYPRRDFFEALRLEARGRDRPPIAGCPAICIASASSLQGSTPIAIAIATYSGTSTRARSPVSMVEMSDCRQRKRRASCIWLSRAAFLARLSTLRSARSTGLRNDFNKRSADLIHARI